ncbi:MAG: NHL repeat-containing protein [Candidatus Baltobacteraceae bacterium]
MRISPILLVGALVGCSSPIAAPLPSNIANAGALAGLARPDLSQQIYVAEAGSYDGAALILEFPIAAKGNVAPSTVIIEPGAVGYNKATGVAVGSTGKIFAANGGIGGESDILEYATHASGSDSPIGDLNGSKTDLDGPWGLAVDKPGDVYVANSWLGEVLYFAAGANGDIAPKRKIGGSKTGMTTPVSIALHDGQIVVADTASDRILAFAGSANGNVAPAWTLAGSKTGFGGPVGVAYDSSGELYVTDHVNNEVLVFAKGAKGNVAPIRTIVGSKTQLNAIHNLALDAQDELIVLSAGVCVFAKGAHGNVAPIRVIQGLKTDLGVNTGLAVR